MKLEAARCPSCGANLSVNPNEKVMTCEFCGGSVTVKEAIRLYKGAVETVRGEAEKERLVEMAEDCYKNGFYSEAAETFSIISKDYPNDYRGWLGMFRCMLSCEKLHIPDFRYSIDDICKRIIAFAPEDIKTEITRYRQLEDEIGKSKEKRKELAKEIKQARHSADENRNCLDEVESHFKEEEEKYKECLSQIDKLSKSIKLRFVAFIISLIIVILSLIGIVVLRSITGDHNNISSILFAPFSLCLLICYGVYPSVKLQSKKELQNNLDENKKELSNIPTAISHLDSELKQTEAEIERLEKEAEALTLEIKRLEAEATDLAGELRKS